MYTLSHHELRYDLIHELTKYVLCMGSNPGCWAFLEGNCIENFKKLQREKWGLFYD